MSQLTIAHHELMARVRWTARHLADMVAKIDFSEIVIDYQVTVYHKVDRYREVSITASNHSYINRLQAIVLDQLPARRVRIFHEQRKDHRGNLTLRFTIWPL